jgi:hypothetical protein
VRSISSRCSACLSVGLKPPDPEPDQCCFHTISRPHRFIAPAIEQRKEGVFSFLSGWRSTPGTIPAINQLDRLNSTTAINVVSMSRAIRDRLRSFGLRCRGMGGSVARFTSAPMDIILAARPIESAHERPMQLDPNLRTSPGKGGASGSGWLTECSERGHDSGATTPFPHLADVIG